MFIKSVRVNSNSISKHSFFGTVPVAASSAFTAVARLFTVTHFHRNHGIGKPERYGVNRDHHTPEDLDSQGSFAATDSESYD